MIRAVTLFATLLIWLSGYAQYLCIYRNDGHFHLADLAKGAFELNHSVDLGKDAAVTGGEEIPVTAIDSVVVRQAYIPVLDFTLPGNEHLDWVVEKEEYIPATLDIDGSRARESYTGLTLNVKGRGNSTWAFEKKPMRLKFGSKTSLFGMTKAKSYVLLADYLDPTLMRNALAHWLARKVGADFPCHTTPCHVNVNGRYAGAYLLTEKIGIGKASVDIDEASGVLLELSVEYDEEYRFRSTLYDLPVMVKDPDLNEIAADLLTTPESMLESWRKDFYNAELGMLRGRAPDYFDMASLAAYMLVSNIVCNEELFFPKSLYMSKAAVGSTHKYRFGPLWDYDSAFNLTTPDGFGGLSTRSPHTSVGLHSFLKKLVSHAAFHDEYCRLFDRFYDEWQHDMFDWIEQYAREIEPSAKLDGERWPATRNLGWAWRLPSYYHQGHVKELREWLEERISFLRERRLSGDLF